MNKGIFYGVGVGPGDPELLTIKALRVLERCAVLAAPETRTGQTLALDIAKESIDLTDKTILRLRFPMIAAERRAAYERAWAQIEPYLDGGADVAMPCLGDVAIYATFGVLRDLAAARGYQSETVPGVTSFCAAAARLGVSLAEGGEQLHIVPGHGNVDDALALSGTKVFMKSGRELPDLMNALAARGLFGRSMLVKNCGLAGEETVADLSKAGLAEDMGYFVTVIVKE